MEVITIFVIHDFLCGIKFIITSIFLVFKWFFIGFITSFSILPRYFIIGVWCIFSKKKRNSLDFSKPILPVIMLILSLFTYFISIFIFTRWFVQNERVKKMTDNILDSDIIIQENDDNNQDEDYDLGEFETTSNNDNNNVDNFSFDSIDFDYLLSKNSDVKGWIKIYGTYVNYPFVQYSDNDYYLEHDIYNRSTNVGWIYADYRVNMDEFSMNTILYGHNLTNKSMFGSLPFVLKSSWYKKESNHIIKLSTLKYNTTWEVFSVYKIEPVVDYLKTNFGNEYEYTEWLNLMKSRSIYDFGVTVGEEDNILTLSTCDDIGTHRVVLHAKLISKENR